MLEKKLNKTTPVRKRQHSAPKGEKFTPTPKRQKTVSDMSDKAESDAREEKKMRQLLEQIARMEEREKKRKSGGKYRSDSFSDEKVSKSGSLLSPNDSEMLKTDIGKTVSVQPRSDSVSSIVTPGIDTESYVAKKRWLRQASSEGISARTSAEENQSGQPFAGFSSPVFNMASPSNYIDQRLQQSPSSAVYDTQVYQQTQPQIPNAQAPDGELVAAEECVLGDLGGPDGFSRPSSSSADSVTTTPAQVETEPERPPKKKVRMSLDEYKKRKRDVPDFPSNGDQSTPTLAPNVGENSNDANSIDGSTTPSSFNFDSSSGKSFIPHLKETELYGQPVRLGSLPDPRLIGKTSASLEELRRRIYGRSLNANIPIGNHPAGGSTEYNSFANTSSHQMNESALAETDTGHRMSLMDRLKNEFGLDDHT